MEEDSMTMVFRVQDPAMLKSLKAGYKVKFDAGRVNGQITVTAIQKAKSLSLHPIEQTGIPP
jgi:Cu/Ag efflux protein CusF